MKRLLTLAVLGFAFASSVSCSSAPKQEEAPVTTASASDEAELDQAVEEETAQEPVKTEASDYSLGAGSSGRGH